MALDIIVKFEGTVSTTRALDLNDIFPETKLVAYRKKLGRSLLLMGQSTRTIREASAGLIADYLAGIKNAVRELEPGRIFIYGSSSGGRNALDLAVAVTKANIPITLVAALDAAFFPNEAVNRPDS